VGKYALKFSWNDNHDLGIYSWFYLREVCPCAECAAGAGIGLSFQLCSGCGAADSAAGKIDSDAQPLKGCLISMNLRYR
jgi:hypothetical protein